MITKKKRTLVAGAATSMFAVAALSGCSMSKPPIDQQQLHGLQADHDRFCKDNGQRLITYVLNDRSGSENPVINTRLRLPAIKREVELATVCNGMVSVNDFAGSSSANVNLFTGHVGTGSGTVASQLRKVPGETASVMSQIEKAQADEGPLLSRKGTNINAQLFNAESFFATVPAGNNTYRVLVLTDGAATSTVSGTVKFPADTTVAFAGIGQFGSTHAHPSESRIQSMEAALNEACAHTGATCIPATTNYDGVAVTNK